ncbi:MAG: bifunctional isocitrate dehydrogenase kinase/phosphatase [Gammaproteobacteria bacterium]|nr:bifunctional isocitrate dehydrogenase kinase/phosphatase [Gammaproteobacteria bacterium]MYG12549.1 bifunctional isocitrate dehydrogenase kinase/phosphatase [Gammaproteobacteria bacterium]MYK27572.1 bifunctional isocitrate dehydrogenase kinase/phosphatase [Gammaproteobacteria bacterium]
MAQDAANAILAGFRAYRGHFERITAGAGERFRDVDWPNVQAASLARLNLYKTHIDRVTAQIGSGPEDLPPTRWRGIKRAYAEAIAAMPDGDLAETFYNSVHRRITCNPALDSERMFLATSFNGGPPPPAGESLTSCYRPNAGLTDMVRRILDERAPGTPWQDQGRDIRNIIRSLIEARPEVASGTDFQVEVVNALFYRNKGAYIVGRLRLGDASSDARRQRVWPLALPLAMSASGDAYVDTLICDEDELSIVFSFTRAYFMVRSHYPFGLVRFLNELLPNKKRSELYAAIGQHKHGKTEFHRGFLEHLRQSSDTFVAAPGIKGMVMTVFTLPSYQTVFKVIRDEFPPQKAVTADEVRKKYHIVKRHDRAGRMADTQEFKDLRLPLHRFDPELIDELRAAAPSALHIEDGQLRIRHLYTERAMTPLNLYIENADRAILTEALDEYGNAIKQLAAANIFPGDMLLKNFGVTRHRRVVFYDYDEISFLTDINFRAVPEPRTPEEEMAAEPWYSVGSNDVFPEEFRRFLFGKPEIKRLFAALHGDLFTPEYWRGLQQAIADGHAMDVFPYRRKRRFSNQRRDVDSPAQK